MQLAHLNSLPREEAFRYLETCCVSKKWIDAMLDARPFKSEQALLSCSEKAWAQVKRADILQAFEGHPRIGDVSSLKKKYANTSALAGHEQSGMSQAQDRVIKKMAQANDAYFQKFGYIFIVCASGKSAEQMLAIIEARLPNSDDIELAIAASEQLKITQLRLKNLVST